MELHAEHRQPRMAQRHNDALAVARAHFQFARQGALLDHQRMIAPGAQLPGRAAEERRAVVDDLVGLAVHRLGSADNLAAEGLPDALMAEADAKDRNAPRRLSVQSAGESDQFQADPGL